ncbi:TPA: GIY-YIG nuclease family protein [Escherichia coli]|nr:GIY-YIG nuclease family protein [Escherichia coli]
MMIEQIPFDNGIYNIDNNSLDIFDIEFDLIEIEAKIRVSSRAYIDKHIMKNYNPNEHVVYILVRDNKPVYVGQSKDSFNRINTHKYKNKCNFDRCFMFSKPKKDLRAFLDYMEKYLIYKIEENGIILENNIRIDPEKDILNKNKKIVSEKWIDTFIKFLIIFGISLEQEELLENNINKTVAVVLKDNQTEINTVKKIKTKVIISQDQNIIEGHNNKYILGNLIKEIGFIKIKPYLNKINTSNAFLIKEHPFDNIISNNRIPVLKFIDNQDEEFYISIHISSLDFIKKIKNVLNLINEHNNYQIEIK